MNSEAATAALEWLRTPGGTVTAVAAMQIMVVRWSTRPNGNVRWSTYGLCASGIGLIIYNAIG